MTVRWASVYLLSVALTVYCQSSNVTCSPSYDWASNSRDQNPCLVSSYLQSACGQLVNVNEIPAGTHYLGPTAQQASACSCSSVVYSLTSACGMCQSRTIVNWTTWTDNCPEDLQTVANFPRAIPGGTEVPLWALQNVTAEPGQQFNPFVAEEAAQQPAPSSSISSSPPQVTRTPSDTATLPPAVTSSTRSAASPTPTTNASSDSGGTSRSSNAGAIAGGVVGGLVGLVAIGLLVLWLHLKKKRKEQSAPPKDFVIDEASTVRNAPSSTMSPPPMTQSISPFSTNIYGSSPSPRPTGPARHPSSISEMYTTLTTRRSQESFNASQFGTHVPASRPGGSYRGAPEV
ncbi:hypothetical protein BKA70DRAFT_1247143 [Coprinopsis sp. MPI-PUGE-AT-0042]|nr:hypothetical protein BKA70DRAFT_1247143 [Coprinopsis sp. MPI-PUGE-AT-0042]